MAREKRMKSIGFYHVLNRGVEQRKIYMDEDDHLKFLEILDESAAVYSCEIYAYALMDNHYHLLLKTSALNLSLLMGQINSRYRKVGVKSLLFTKIPDIHTKRH